MGIHARGPESDRAADSARVRTRRNGAAADQKDCFQTLYASEHDVASGPGEVAQNLRSPTGPRPYNRTRSASRELSGND